MPQLVEFLVPDDPEEKDKIVYYEVPVGFPTATELDLIRQFVGAYPPLPQMGKLSLRVSNSSSDTPNVMLSRKGDTQAGSIPVMLIMNISKQEEPQYSERVKCTLP